MFKEKITSPFHGHPKTLRKIDKSGNESFHITPCALTPVGAQIADAIAASGTVSIIFYAVHYISHLPGAPDWWFFAAFGSGYLIWPCLKWFNRFGLKKKNGSG